MRNDTWARIDQAIIETAGNPDCQNHPSPLDARKAVGATSDDLLLCEDCLYRRYVQTHPVAKDAADYNRYLHYRRRAVGKLASQI
jgi:hypothetical protein